MYKICQRYRASQQNMCTGKARLSQPITSKPNFMLTQPKAGSNHSQVYMVKN